MSKMDKQLSQSEIDAVFQSLNNDKADDTLSKKAILFDFRRPDRIAKSQLRAIHQLHDNFVRNLVSSLSAYLRSYLMINLVSVEQLSYAEFLECLPSPTCIASLGLKPYDGNAILELNSSLIFPILEMLLGGNGKSSTSIQRELTEIEQSLLDGLFRIILHDLKESWRFVTNIDFSMESMETEPQFLQILAPSEAVVAIAIEIRIGESIGMMNIAIPSIIIKMMRQKFDQQWSVRKSESTDSEQVRILDLIRNSEIGIDVRLEGASLFLKDLMKLDAGDVLVFDAAIQKPLHCLLNGVPKFSGNISAGDHKLCFRVGQPITE
jgi:flagellar motor switch protein FliM